MDERIQAARRAFDGGQIPYSALLVARVRAGDLTVQELRIACLMGSEDAYAAMVALGVGVESEASAGCWEMMGTNEGAFNTFIKMIPRQRPLVVTVRATLAIAKWMFSRWRCADSDAFRYDLAQSILLAGGRWCGCPCKTCTNSVSILEHSLDGIQWAKAVGRVTWGVTMPAPVRGSMAANAFFAAVASARDWPEFSAVQAATAIKNDLVPWALRNEDTARVMPWTNEKIGGNDRWLAQDIEGEPWTT